MVVVPMKMTAEIKVYLLQRQTAASRREQTLCSNEVQGQRNCR
jgi:hypothetical protein